MRQIDRENQAYTALLRLIDEALAIRVMFAEAGLDLPPPLARLIDGAASDGELQRFREREPMVVELLRAVFPPDGIPPAVTTGENAGSPYQIRLAAEAVRDFKVNP